MDLNSEQFQDGSGSPASKHLYWRSTRAKTLLVFFKAYEARDILDPSRICLVRDEAFQGRVHFSWKSNNYSTQDWLFMVLFLCDSKSFKLLAHLKRSWSTWHSCAFSAEVPLMDKEFPAAVGSWCAHNDREMNSAHQQACSLPRKTCCLRSFTRDTGDLKSGCKPCFKVDELLNHIYIGD